ncbi:tetratricopeptide repeat protein 17 [Contarinia nasturtii]|uniref:tetratricopeptide repeat protein 17 n=1 Tax=Contarinia nasturtii TaxID=265458 RepID=UPI0012D3FE65|nr:tetratricopeptide repeat protein 17 [Contarinia nasturtii]
MISSILIITLIVALVFLNRYDEVSAINHWGISDGSIEPQVDSIFYLRRPDDLVAFLNQFDYRQTINTINAQLLSLQLEITDKVQQSTFFQVEIMSHTECLIYYSLKDDDMYSTLKDKKYFNRINTKRMITKSNDLKRGNDVYPVCDDVPFSMSCFEHLNSMINRRRLQMNAEVSLHADEIGVLKDSFVKMIKFGLAQEQLSWKYPVLASYFWRARGNAKRAVECARRAIYLAPRKYQDIPLLSLATILQRANKSQDALVVMQSAFNHAPDVFENQIGLGNAQFLASDFSGALKTFKNAVTLDSQFNGRLEFIQKSMSCFKTIKQKLNEFQHQVDEIFGLLNNYKRNQTMLEEYLNRVLSEQVPIANRLADPSFDVYSHHLLHRGQYCKTKEMPDSKEPILFCDFYTDLQSQLQKEDLIVDIVHHFAEAAPKFIDNFSLGVYRYLNIEDFNENDNGGKPPSPPPPSSSTDNTKKDTQTTTRTTTAAIDADVPLNFDMKQYEVL